jgi:hypothetical protein
MSTKTVSIRAEVDRETDQELENWSESEERSKRRHTSVLLRKLTVLRKTNPDDLQRLGLMERSLAGTR